MQASTLLSEFSVVLSALLGGVTTDLNAFADLNYTSNFSCPTDGTAGGIKGPSIGQLTATVSMDSSFYSWVGCNCSDGNDDREYTISSSGEQPALMHMGSPAQLDMALCNLQQSDRPGADIQTAPMHMYL